jgi:deoxyribonuclease-4
MIYYGAHISRNKTLIETMETIKKANGNSLQIFISNPRSIQLSNLNKSFFGDNLEIINSYLHKNNFKLVIHSPYTINLSSNPISNKRHIDLKDCYWIKLMINELTIAHQLGAIGCVVHCGKYTNNSYENGIKNMRNAILYLINYLMENNLNSKLILETSTGQGTEVLSNFEDFLIFYYSFTNKQREYLKLCIDTCHIWAAGYELIDVFHLIKKYDSFNDIYVIHINNSKNKKGSRLDRHDVIKSGFIPLTDITQFIKMMNKMNHNIVNILETPSNDLSYELFIIYK